MSELEQLVHAAHAALNNPTASQADLETALHHLRAWHYSHHGGVNSVLCTGCAIYPIIVALEFELLIYVPGVPRPVGAERTRAVVRLLNAIRGTTEEAHL